MTSQPNENICPHDKDPRHCGECYRDGYSYLDRMKVENLSRQNPIWGTDFSKNLSEIIAGLRNDIVQVRGQLNDIGAAYSGWRERVKDIEGLLTCGLIAMYEVMEEMKVWEKDNAHTKAPD